MNIATADPAEDFTTSEGLRHVLTRLHRQGPGAWQHDPTAGLLMAHAACKYAPLAKRHGLDPAGLPAVHQQLREAGATVLTL